ncbi:MAG TPA: substrate-binding domain-containing protein, partial [Acidimicrobiia bacterium]|nr:substrate-binding domain-containing protein [Acidimicrobiia bacterium]
MTRTRLAAALALGVALVLTASACGYHSDTAEVHLANPGRCAPVDIAAAPETASLLGDAASRFNGSAAARSPGGSCAFVRVHMIDSPVALRELADNWPDVQHLGPAPAAWVPGSTMWGELLNARLARRHRAAMAPNGTPFARTPLVVAMPAPMARALDYPHRPVGWVDLAQLARDPRGWAAYGHPEWGRFRLGKGNPTWSTTGLDQTIALDASGAGTDARYLEQSVEYYGDTTQPYFDNWKRLAKKSTSRALTYLSAAIADERSVVAYNSGHQQDDVSLTGHATRPSLPLVAIYPKDATIESDNPVIVLDASWSSAGTRTGARLFATFVGQRPIQAKVAAAGFRPARGAPRTDVLNPGNGVDTGAPATPVAPASPTEIERAITRWEAMRRRGRVLVVFDVSDSMGDSADPFKPHSPTKIARARAALAGALGQLSLDDAIGLRIFTTGLPGRAGVSADWRDVVPIGPLAQRGPALERAITALTPLRGSPLYAATRDAFDTVAQTADPQRINGVIVLTDG